MKCIQTICQSFILSSLLLFYAHTAAAVTIEQTNFSDKETIQPTSEIKLKLDRLPSQKEGRLAIFIGQTDVTSQFRIVGNELIYQSKDFPLPSGETKLIVYLVKENNQWQEIAQLPLKVSTQPEAEQPTDSKVTSAPTQSPSTTQEQTQPGQPQPTQTPSTTQEQTQPGQTQPTQPPSTTQEQTQPGQPQPTEQPTPGSASTESAPLKLEFEIKSQLLEERNGNKPNSQRPTFADLTFKADINTGQQRFGDLGIESKFQFFGSTFDKDPILPTTQLNKNPQNIDLTEYNVNVTFGPAALSLGQGNSYGNHPFLLDQITNRGLILSSKLGDRFDISFSSLSATNIIGIDNFLGFTEYDNNITAATLGFQIVKNSSQEGPRGVRLEGTWMTGSRKPISNVDQGEVVDAEESDGFGLRLLANDNSNRLRIDGGFARSTFSDPSQRKDPQLTEGVNVVPVEPATKNAYYMQADYDLLRGVKLGNDRTLKLTLTARHERIDPQYNTIGASSFTVDQLANTLSLNGEIAGATVTLGQIWSENNLADIANIAKNKNRNTAFNLNVPLQTLLALKNTLLPTLKYSFLRNHQFTVNNPIPAERLEVDQLDTTHTFGIEWNIPNSGIMLSYNFSSTFKDNRKPSEALEGDDPSNQQPDSQEFTNMIMFDWQISPRFGFNLGYMWTSSRSLQTGLTNFTGNPTLGLRWQMDPSMMLMVNLSRNENTDSLNQGFNRDDDFNVTLTRMFTIDGPAGLKLPGTVFLRYGMLSNINRLFEDSTDGTIHTVNGGISISF
ncbi:hypothetical protein DP114_01770 [Brasilonema sennae CENA114]|uniref:Uncharacterized protein n=1 Tax=Brasilonema sennae CENA114 TaxID=415709 RepID=A0A856M9V6_9CYAN|nr:hypothetical protein [Brasilonema sennae]QDL06799.1 hypothetical protein DP114_01770 [Brasilonema sennae CENA114]